MIAPRRLKNAVPPVAHPPIVTRFPSAPPYVCFLYQRKGKKLPRWAVIDARVHETNKGVSFSHGGLHLIHVYTRGGTKTEQGILKGHIQFQLAEDDGNLITVIIRITTTRHEIAIRIDGYFQRLNGW